MWFIYNDKKLNVRNFFRISDTRFISSRIVVRTNLNTFWSLIGFYIRVIFAQNSHHFLFIKQPEKLHILWNIGGFEPNFMPLNLRVSGKARVMHLVIPALVFFLHDTLISKSDRPMGYAS